MRLVGCVLLASLLSWEVVAQNSTPCWAKCRSSLSSDCQNLDDVRCICTQAVRQCVQKACSNDPKRLAQYSEKCPSNTTKPSSSSVLSSSPTHTPSTPVAPTPSVNVSVSPPTSPSTSAVLSTSLTSSSSSSTSISIPVPADSDSTTRTSFTSLTTIVTVVSGTSSSTTVLLTLPNNIPPTDPSAPIDPPAPNKPTNNLSTAGSEKKNKSNAGTIAGGIIGGLAALAILMGLVRWARRGDSTGYERDFDEKVEEPPLVQEQSEPPPAQTQRQSLSSDISYV